tara:strand:+ start:531 stop:1292 length:762 start_codon:yes stop_codon:yes gene_type:complete
MSIWGKLIGGATGMALGGPIGAILGIAAGHGVDRVRKLDSSESNQKLSLEQKEQIFATSVIALSAKIAKADGNISKSEILAFKKIFEFPKEDEKAISEIFNSAKENIEDYKEIAKQVFDVFKNEKSLLLELLNSLFSIAYADGDLHYKEEIILLEISKIFSFSKSEFDSISNIHSSKNSEEFYNINKSYKILGVTKNSSTEQISIKYKELVKEYHPDRLQGMGLPEEFIELANQKLTAINKAYNDIKNEKKNN